MFYLSSRVQFGPNQGKKHTKLFFAFPKFISLNFQLCVVFSRARIAFQKNPEVKHRIYFMRPYQFPGFLLFQNEKDSFDEHLIMRRIDRIRRCEKKLLRRRRSASPASNRVCGNMYNGPYMMPFTHTLPCDRPSRFP